MQYIIDCLEAMPTGQRVAEAESLFHAFADEKDWESSFPYGFLRMVSVFNMPSRDYWERFVTSEESFFGKLQALCGGSLPQVWSDHYQRCLRNREHMLALLEKVRTRERTPMIHEIPPFIDNFEAKVIDCYGLFHDINGLPIRITEDRLGRGGYCHVYRASIGDEKVALKLSIPSQLKTSWALEVNNFPLVYRSIRKNLQDHSGLFQQSPFARLYQTVGGKYDMYAIFMELVEGTDMYTLVSENDNSNLDDKVAKTAFLVYAQMLSTLHNKSFVFGDNKLSAVMIRNEGTCSVGDRTIIPEDVRVIDYDFAMPLEVMNAEENKHLLRIGTPQYSSREQRLAHLTRTTMSDLEGFALMLDHWYTGSLWKEVFRDNFRAEEADSINKREYPTNRLACIPAPLQPLIRGVLEYPQDAKITSGDFVTELERV